MDGWWQVVDWWPDQLKMMRTQPYPLLKYRIPGTSGGGGEFHPLITKIVWRVQGQLFLFHGLALIWTMVFPRIFSNRLNMTKQIVLLVKMVNNFTTVRKSIPNHLFIISNTIFSCIAQQLYSVSRSFPVFWARCVHYLLITEALIKHFN